jgi:glycosyltransferase involved in cell wall biosynthesis
MRIVVFANEQEPSSHYRAFEPAYALAARGHNVRINGRDDRIAPEAQDSDVALISRYVGAEAEELARRLRRIGIAVVWDHDDAVDLMPERRAGSLEVERRKASVRAMLTLADGVTTTSELLAAHYRELGAGAVRVIENHLGEHYAQLHRPPHDGLVVGWAAWIDHRRDWRELGLRDVFERLLDAHPHVRVESIAIDDLGLPRERYTWRDAVYFTELGRHIAAFDVGIAPIADTPFNRCRSNIKLKEYAAAGVPWLASPIGPYVGLGEKQGGRLVPDDRWFEELDRLIRDERSRRKLAKRGRRWAATQTIVRNADAWEQALADAVDRSRARPRALTG